MNPVYADSIKGSKLRGFSAIAVSVVLLLSLPALSFAGAFTYSDVGGVDRILHPMGYNGTGGELIITVGIDPTSANAAAMQIPVQNIVNVYNQLTVTTGNLVFGGLTSQLDFESTAIHELGHALGLAHPNLATESGVNPAYYDYTKTTEGVNGSYDLNAGVDFIKGSYDDIRGDDVNRHWFKTDDNDPFSIGGIVDATTYSVDVGDLPVGDTFAANGDRDVGAALGYPNTEAVMQQGQLTNEKQRTLAADDVATLRLGMSGIDEIEGTGDDYFITLVYAGLDAGADIVLDFDNSKTNLATCYTAATVISSGHLSVTSAPIYFNTGYNWFFNEVLLNIPPVITGQYMLTTPEETPLTITLSNLHVSDPDNTYPNDFTLSIQDGANYTRAGNTITPATNFTGTLTVPATVNDGTDDSNVYNLSVEVTPVNDVPVITGQNVLSTPDETSLTIALNDLLVTDPDNTYPDDFTLSIQDGANYTRAGNTITPATNFTGTLTVPATVNDGTDDSNVYNLSVEVVATVYVEPSDVCGGKATCYASIQQAIDAAALLPDSQVNIYIASDTYAENIDLNVAKTLLIQGGWDTGFSFNNPANPATVVSVGPSFIAMTVSDGAVNVENFVLQ